MWVCLGNECGGHGNGDRTGGAATTRGEREPHAGVRVAAAATTHVSVPSSASTTGSVHGADYKGDGAWDEMVKGRGDTFVEMRNGEGVGVWGTRRSAGRE